MKLGLIITSGMAIGLCLPAAIFAQAPPGTGLSAKAAAPIDLTGYWVSVVTEDWRYRMLTAPKGDYYSIPLTPEARKVADTWDAAKDVAQGKQCMAYGAPAVMRQPGRVHITWDNDNTLKVEIDAGKQTRLFVFGRAAPAGRGHIARQFGGPVAIAADHTILHIEDQRAGSKHSWIPRTNPGGIGSARHAQARRDSQGGDHAPTSRISPQQRGAVQRQRGAHGVLRYPSRRRPGVHGHYIYRGGPAVSLRPLGRQQSVPPRGRWIQMEAAALRADPVFEMRASRL